MTVHTPDEPATLSEEDWEVLLDAIEHGKCTPFLGSGVCHGVVPLAADIAQKWAGEEHYPLDDHWDLARVAQFIATKYDPVYTKQKIADYIRAIDPPDFGERDEPHAVLADLPLPIYITTNYDDFMFRALSRLPGKEPMLEMCRWNSRVRQERSYLGEGVELTVDRPMVYHLHGWSGVPESLVLSEDDYLDFLVNLWKDKLIPHRIERAMSGASLLFLGYRLADWDFRVLFRSLVSYLEISLGRRHISVQLPPIERDAPPDRKQKVKQYLDRYFGSRQIRVFWGPCREFVTELKRRREARRAR
ncbi:MAG TPA: SIR2 family protein [Thermoanaerobaculia bacterium]|nr:SIR2 family protein [Thermoanaerobaculia bacterium]